MAGVSQADHLNVMLSRLQAALFWPFGVNCLHRQHDVVVHRQPRHQGIGLKNHTAVGPRAGDWPAIFADDALVWLNQTSD